MIEAYPLQWPMGWKRIAKYNRQRARFDTPFGKARDNLLTEIRLLGGQNPIISSNIRLRLDGLPYADFKEPDDCGIAVYFELDGHQECFPCNRWNRAVDNLHAIELCIGALRGLERWGAKDMVRASFRGFEALPEHKDEDIVKSKVDYFEDCHTKEERKKRFRTLSKTLHPDVKGSNDEFITMVRQYEKTQEV